MKATGEGAHKIEGQGPFSYQGEIYNLCAKIHIYWLGTMTTYKTLVQRKRKAALKQAREPQNRQRLRVF